MEEKPIYLTYEDYSPEDLYLYGGIDCLVTSELASKLMPEAFDEKNYTKYKRINSKTMGKQICRLPSIFDVYQNTTAIAFEFILDLELNGMKYDVDGNRKIAERMTKEISELEEIIFKGIGKTINLNSGEELRKLLYGDLGFTATSFTKTGEPSTDGDAVKDLAKRFPDYVWLPSLAKRNDIASLYRTFIATYVEDFVKPDGRIHPSYNLHGTGSFRISGEEPNLTQIARPKHGYNIRTLYTVEDGMVFIAADYSGCEIKILNALCDDKGLAEAIRLGRDFHSVSAAAMFGMDYDEFVAVLADEHHEKYKEYKGLRQYAKALST